MRSSPPTDPTTTKPPRVAENGMIVTHYEREGEIKIGDAGLDSPSDRELARQERMKREG